MHPAFKLRLLALAFAVPATAAGCGGDGGTGGDPTDVMLGETTFVVVANPTMNELTDVAVPPPGTRRDDVSVTADAGGPSVRTGTDGVGVLAPVEPGLRTLAVSGGGLEGEVMETIAEGDLVELAFAAEDARVERMVRIEYAFGRTVVELTPDMPVSQVNDALAESDVIVLLAGGTYEGDLEFSGSGVTLFGAGVTGGEVTIDGDVAVGGSGNRIRGATITGTLDVSGSNFGMSFSRIEGQTTISGSTVTLLQSELCGAVDVGGSDIVALGNAGLAPIDAPADCP